jgi:hypothetical protein
LSEESDSPVAAQPAVSASRKPQPYLPPPRAHALLEEQKREQEKLEDENRVLRQKLKEAKRVAIFEAEQTESRATTELRADVARMQQQLAQVVSALPVLASPTAAVPATVPLLTSAPSGRLPVYTAPSARTPVTASIGTRQARTTSLMATSLGYDSEEDDEDRTYARSVVAPGHVQQHYAQLLHPHERSDTDLRDNVAMSLLAFANGNNDILGYVRNNVHFRDSRNRREAARWATMMQEVFTMFHEDTARHARMFALTAKWHTILQALIWSDQSGDSSVLDVADQSNYMYAPFEMMRPVMQQVRMVKSATKVDKEDKKKTTGAGGAGGSA